MNEYTIILSSEEALILFELVSRIDDDETFAFEDQAEQRVIWNLQADLERGLPAVLARDYKSQLANARANVRDSLD